MLSAVVTLGIRTEGEYKEMADDLEREWENNAQSKMIVHIFLGQKPLDDK